MSFSIEDFEQLGARHYVDTLDRGLVRRSIIQYERFDELRRAHDGNFCVILYVQDSKVDDYFVIPFQVVSDALAGKASERQTRDCSSPGWKGTISNNSTLHIEGCRSLPIVSSYQKADLLVWLLDGNDLFSFSQRHLDEEASGWLPYESPGPADAQKLKLLLDNATKVPGRQYDGREGQAEFRENLRQRYGDQCMVSGCGLLGIVEAAHIVPYSRSMDHHPANGLLLRADLHSLFDLHLLGIEPESLTVRVHLSARRAGYGCFNAVQLRLLSELRPNSDALELRWQWFNERCGRRS